MQYPTIYTGDDAEQAFGHLVLRDPEVMRRQTAEAFRSIWEILAEWRQSNEADR